MIWRSKRNQRSSEEPLQHNVPDDSAPPDNDKPAPSSVRGQVVSINPAVLSLYEGSGELAARFSLIHGTRELPA